MSAASKIGLIAIASLAASIPLRQLYFHYTFVDPKSGIKAYSEGRYSEAMAELKPAADRGDIVAQRVIGFMYQHGEGVTVDLKQAADWYQKAAEEGDPQAQTDLAIMIEQGKGRTIDHVQAATWFQQAANQGETRAQFDLGDLYFEGRGLGKDKEQAEYWYSRAADGFRESARKGNAEAQVSLGYQYASGKGVQLDPVLAYMLFSLAAERSDEMARENLINLSKKLSPEQVTEGRSLASWWNPGDPFPTETKTGQIRYSAAPAR